MTNTTQPREPALVCLAGNMCSPQVFDRVHIPDGIGRVYIDYLTSEGPWDIDHLGQQVIDTIKELRIGPVFLAGYSAGGVVAIAAAAQNPDIISGLILSNTGPCSIGHGSPGFADELKANYNNETYIRSFLASCFYHKPSEEIMDIMWQYTRTVNPDAAYIVSKTLREVDYRQTLKNYKNPALIIHGILDTRRKMDSVEMIQSSLPQARTVMLQTGHTPMLEDPDGYEGALNSFIEQILCRDC